MPITKGLSVGTATAMLLVTLASCAELDPQPDGDGKRASPCENGAIHDLGAPGPFRRFASFEVVQGPAWLAVEDWQVTGVIDPRGQKGLLTLGPVEQPPVVDQNGHIASKSEQVEVERALWSRLDLAPDSYWLLGTGSSGNISIQTCDDAIVQAVKPAA